MNVLFNTETPEKKADKFKSLISKKIQEIRTVSRPQIYDTLLIEIDKKLQESNFKLQNF